MNDHVEIPELTDADEELLARHEASEAWPERKPEVTTWTADDALKRLRTHDATDRFSVGQWVRFMDDDQPLVGKVERIHPNGRWMTVNIPAMSVTRLAEGERLVQGLANDVPIVLDVTRTKVAIDRTHALLGGTPDLRGLANELGVPVTAAT